MKLQALLALFALFTLQANARSVPLQGREAPLVSAQGVLFMGDDPLLRVSPMGTLKLRIEVLEGDLHAIVMRVRLAQPEDSRVVLPRILADEILATDTGKLIAIRTHESNRFPTGVTLHDLDGRRLLTRNVMYFSDPQLSPDGAFFAYRSQDGVHVLDLTTLQEDLLPRFDLFTAESGGALIALPIRGERRVEVWRDGSLAQVAEALNDPLDLALLGDSSALLLGERSLVELNLRNGTQRVLYQAPANVELRDLMRSAGKLFVGRRTVLAGAARGSVLQLGPAGFLVQAPSNSIRVPSVPNLQDMPVDGLPWPLAPNSQHPIGNSYGEYQNYGGIPYLHPGIDVLGADNQPVYAVHAGVVKAVLTTSGSYHWRLAIANTAGAGTSEGYLYAHIDQPTIAVNVGDSVAKGQYLGDLVPWPVAGFTHTHFARIEDSGATWSGAWINTDNPHTDLVNRSDATPPVFDPALGADVFAFCTNNTSSYLNPTALMGKVDIIARISDTISSPWRCAVQSIRYSIHPVGMAGSPIVDNRLSVNFDMLLDTYAGGPIDPFLVSLLYKQDFTCTTEGDYGSREFYHIITNSNGDEVYDAADLAEAWDTSLLSDGNYVVSVRAIDATGNESLAAMTVTTSNGNP